MSSTFVEDMIQSYFKTNGQLLTVLSIALGFVPFIIDPKTHYEFECRWLVLLLIPIFIFATGFITILHMLLVARRRAKVELPKTLAAFQYNNKLFLLLEPSELFVTDGLVSIFHKSLPEIGGAELRIGIGSVWNIQEDKKVQIAVLSSVEVDSEIWKKIRNNDNAVVQAVVIKPSVPHSVLAGGSLNG